MKFGLFGGAGATPDDVVTEASLGYHEYSDYIVLAEKLGYASAWLAEHHFTGFTQLSATLNYIAYLAARTSTIRLGSAVIVVPWHNPVLLAEQIATVDQLSRGRYDCGIGKGYRYNEFHGFNLDPAAAGGIYEEAVEIIKRSFVETERWSYKSDRWQFNDIIVEPPVVQKPYPPMWLGAASLDSVRRAAQQGYRLLLDQTAPFEAIAERVNIYREELERLGKPFDPYAVGVTRGLMVANTPEARARQHARRSQLFTGIQVLTRDPRLQARTFGPAGGGDPVAMSEAGAIIGNSQEMVDRVGRMHDAGVRLVLLCDVSPGHQEMTDHLRQVAEEVMPHFADDRAVAGNRKAAAE